jgi:hypothetical protein
VSSSSGLIFAAECSHCKDEESISAVYLQGPSFLLTLQFIIQLEASNKVKDELLIIYSISLLTPRA